MSELTTWFPAQIKPVHVGLYDVQDLSIRCNCCFTWAYWDGVAFVRYGVFAGMKVRKEVIGVRRWRGLAAKNVETES